MHETSPRHSAARSHHAARRTRRAAAALAFSLLPFTAFAAGSQGTWKQLPSHGDALSVRSTPAVGALGHMVYLFGGVKDDLAAGTNTFYNDLHRFDVLTNQWVALNPQGELPAARGFSASVSLPSENGLLVFGGAWYTPDYSSMVFYNDLWRYDAGSNHWSKIQPANDGPTQRAQAALWQSGRTVYLFGGIDSSWQTLNDLWSFDLQTQRWTLLQENGAASAPASRSETANGERPHAGKLTISGGMTVVNSEFFTLGDTWEYDLRSQTWTDVTPAAGKNITPERSISASALLGNALYVQGGDLPGGTTGCNAGFPQNPTNELWRFDTRAHEWTQLAPKGDPLPTLKRHVAAAVLGKMYVFAGFDFQCVDDVGGQVWNSAVYSYTP